MKKLLALLALLALSVLSVVALSADDVKIDSVKIDGDEVAANGLWQIEEGQTMDIRVNLHSTNGIQNVEVEAKIGAYDYSDIESVEDSEDSIDLVQGADRSVKLQLNLPNRLDKQEYWLRIRVMGNTGDAITHNVRLFVTPKDHAVSIADVRFSPGMNVKAGRSLQANVLLENFGDNHEQDVAVTVEIPELGVGYTEFVSVVPMDDEHGRNNVDYESVPAMNLLIPSDAQEKDYDVKVTATYDRVKVTSKTYKVHVTASELFTDKEKLVLAVGPDSQTVGAGKTASFAVALTNSGMTSKAYTLEAFTGGDWATASVSDSLVVLEPGKNKVVYVEIKTAAQANSGEHIANVNIKSGSDLLQAIPLKVNVVPGTAQPTVNLRNGLEVALIVVVVLLVIIGLILGFSRMKKDEGEEKAQTYY